MIDILSKRYLYFAVSLVVIVSGLVLLAVGGLPLSIDFTGGSLLEISFAEGKSLDTEAINNIYEETQIDDAQVTTTENGTLVIRSSFLTNEVRDSILSAMKETSGSEVTVIRFDSVGPSIGKQVASRAALAVAVAALAVETETAAGFDRFAADDLVDRPISALHQDVRLEGGNQCAGVRLREDHDIVHASQRCQHFGSLGFRHDRPVHSLVQVTDRRIAVDADHEQIAEGSGRL